MKRIVFCLVSAFIALALAAGSVWAQATEQISGTVRDQSGAVLPGVEVTVTHTGTGAARTALSNESGSYVLSNLLIGRTVWRLPWRVFARSCKQESYCR